MAEIKFHDYTMKVQKAIDEVAMSALEEAAGELKSQVMRNTKTDTSQTKNSWEHNVKFSKGLYTATVGSPLQNAIWEEFGTGEHALKGNGRQGYWVFVAGQESTKSKSTKSYTLPEAKRAVAYLRSKGLDAYYTSGKKARRPFWKAYSSLKNQLIKFIQDKVKGALK